MTIHFCNRLIIISWYTVKCQGLVKIGPFWNLKQIRFSCKNESQNYSACSKLESKALDQMWTRNHHQYSAVLRYMQKLLFFWLKKDLAWEADSEKIWGKLQVVLNQCDHTCNFWACLTVMFFLMNFIGMKVLSNIILYFHEMFTIDFSDILSMKKHQKQDGAELCLAHVKLKLLLLWLDPCLLWLTYLFKFANLAL